MSWAEIPPPSEDDGVFSRFYTDKTARVYTGPPHADYQQGEARIMLAEETTPQPEPEPTRTRADVLREISVLIDELADMEEADDAED